MKENMLHTPNGVRDILPEEYERKRKLEDGIESVLRYRGYLSVMTPLFEHIDVFTGIGSVPDAKIYKFIARDGSVLALRPDITPQISRIIAANNWNTAAPIRLCYTANTYRYHENYQGKPSEFTQAGAEIYGSASFEADAEVIAAAIQCLLKSGLSDFRIDIGNVRFLRHLLEDSDLSGGEISGIVKSILKRDYVSAANAARDKKLPDGTKEIIANLADYIGDITVLNKCESQITSRAAKEAIDRLKHIYGTLRLMKLDKYVLFDLGLLGHLDYYTEVLFRGYSRGGYAPIVAGGRCDSLMSCFGKKMPSVGFAINTDMLMSALFDAVPAGGTLKSDGTFVSWSGGGKETALLCADSLRQNGICAETSLDGEEIEYCLACAKSAGLGGMLHFYADGTILMFNLKTGEEAKITLDELLKTGRAGSAPR